MIIFYIGQLGEGHTCRDRMVALSHFGHQVIPFDITDYVSGSGLIASLQHRMNVGPAIFRLNRALEFAISSLSHVDVIWVDKGRWLFERTTRLLSTRSGALLVHFTPDPQFVFHGSRYFRRSLRHYDLVVTTKSYEIPQYHRHGATEVLLTYQSFDARRFRPHPVDESLASDVCFVGHYEPHYERALLAAAQTGAHIRVWGPGWDTRAPRIRLPNVHLSGRLFGDRYPIALSSSRIALGLLSKLVPDTTTTRTFEIPACGPMLLAERTPEHMALFAEGIEAEYFASFTEMQDKISHFLGNEARRAEVATRGRERCLSDGYDTEARLRQVLAAIEVSRARKNGPEAAALKSSMASRPGGSK